MAGKRKLDSVEDTPEDSRNIPTPETQKLYDDYRRIEEGLTLGDQLELQDGHDGSGGHAAFLRPPTHSQAPTSPRSPSCASTTHSLTRAFDDTGIEEEDRPNKKRATRAKRNGPLADHSRAKAALMRKIGACTDCKSRRVSCKHFDSTIFEREYQRRKQRELGTPANRRSREGPPPTSQPSFNGPTADLVGTWQPVSLPTQLASGGNQPDAAEAEIDDLLRQNPSTSPVPAAPYYFTANRLPRLFTNLSPTHPPAPRSTFSSADMASMQLSPASSQQVPIGRLRQECWYECRHGDDDAFNLVGACGQVFAHLHELFQHFELTHGPYFDQLSMWKCIERRFGDDGVARACGTLHNDRTTVCIQCGGYRWELWYYASISRTPSLTSGPSVRVGSRDGSMGGFGVPQQQYPWFGAQGHGNGPDFERLFPGRYLDGNQGGGSYHSFEGKTTMEQSSGKWRSFPILLGSCQPEKDCRSKQLLSQYTAGPFLLILSTLFLILMEKLLVAALGNKKTASAVLDTARNHVFWMSLICLFVGLAGMWIFKHIRFRLGEELESSHEKQCPFVGSCGVVEHRDIEDAGSMRGEDEPLAVDVLRHSGTLVMR